MNIKRTLGYSALCTGLLGAGATAERYLAVRPLQNQVTELEQRSEMYEKRVNELQRELRNYFVRLPDGREMKLNPDMSVTISGVNGDSKFDMTPGQYRISLKKEGKIE